MTLVKAAAPSPLASVDISARMTIKRIAVICELAIRADDQAAVFAALDAIESAHAHHCDMTALARMSGKRTPRDMPAKGNWKAASAKGTKQKRK